MIQLNFRNRIAFTYIAVTAALIAVLFLIINFTVSDIVYAHLDSDLDAETNEVYNSLVVLSDTIIYANPLEWKEGEHGQIEVNPTFIQIIDKNGVVIRKTPNLRKINISFNPSIQNKQYFSTTLAGSPVRQLQTEIVSPRNKILGYLIIAIPLEESAVVLDNLRYTLLIGYPIVLIVLFFISRFIAGKSIAPINKVIKTAERISKENLDERIELPSHKDEILTLTLTINNLLDRLQDLIIREKQFTADASHELRTPLSIIKGTLEVLTRKPRDSQQYIEKINYVISEVDRMSILIDQLLELARFESEKIAPNFVQFDLTNIFKNILLRLDTSLKEKNIKLTFLKNNHDYVKADPSMTEIMLENIISNSIKYSPVNSAIEIEISTEPGIAVCSISDTGSGIPAEQISKIFDRFYRIDESRNSQISGKGLGLAIVKRLADLQQISINVHSQETIGTTFILKFKQ
jgi:signal transduction histidine kinase